MALRQRRVALNHRIIFYGQCILTITSDPSIFKMTGTEVDQHTRLDKRRKEEQYSLRYFN